MNDLIQGRIQGGGEAGEGAGGRMDWVASQPSLWGRLSLKITKRNKTISEAILSPIVKSFCRVNHPVTYDRLAFSQSLKLATVSCIFNLQMETFQYLPGRNMSIKIDHRKRRR